MSKLIDSIKFWLLSCKYKRLVKKSKMDLEFDEIDLESDLQFSDDEIKLITRNHLYTRLLNTYVTQYTINQKIKNSKKWRFYKIIMSSYIVMMFFLICAPIIVFLTCEGENVTVFLTFISSLIGLFVSLLVLPKTIAKYMFDPNEDNIISKVVIEMQKQDNCNREIINK